MTKFINANPASRSRWPTPSCRSPTTSAMGKIIWMLGFSSRASWRKSCTARCWSIWYRLFIATLLFFLAEKLPSVIMTGVESRYFLRTNGHPLLASLTLVHWIGLRLSSVVLQLSSSATALTLIALAGACLFHRGASDSALHHPLPTAPTEVLSIFAALIVAFRAVIVTYDGWYEAIYFAEEDKNPTRNLPRAMIGGVVLIVALYLLMNVAFLLVMPIGDLAKSKLPAADAARIVFASGPFAALSGQFVTVLSLLTLISLVNSVMLGAPRILFAVGRDGLFTERVTAVSATGTPRPALLLSSLAAAVLVASGTFDNIVTIAAFFVASIYCLNYLALFTLRQREPAALRPFRAWGYPWSTGLVLLGSFLFLVAAVHGDPITALRAFVLLAISVPVYLWIKRRRMKRRPSASKPV